MPFRSSKSRYFAFSLLALYLSFLPHVLLPERPVRIRRERVIEHHYQILTPAGYVAQKKTYRA